MGQHISANPTSNPAISIRDFFPVPLQTGKIREMFCEDLTPEAKAARDGGIEYVLDYTTDRYSAGDRVREGADARGKGALIALISKKLFSRIKNCVPTAILDEDEINSVFNPDNEFDLVIPPNCTVMRRLKMFKIEAVVRGWFTGSIKGPYKAGKRQFSDAIFPDGLHEMDKLPKNAYTPTNKAPQGEHDELVTFADIVSLLKAEGMGDEAEARIIEGYSLRVFRTLSEILREEYGIVLIDMKLEFGIDELGNIYLADEISPDSCRFVFLEDFIPGQPLKTSDKQILRNWVKAHPDEPVPEEIIKNLLRSYVRIAEALGIDVSGIDMVDLAE